MWRENDDVTVKRFSLGRFENQYGSEPYDNLILPISTPLAVEILRSVASHSFSWKDVLTLCEHASSCVLMGLLAISHGMNCESASGVKRAQFTLPFIKFSVDKKNQLVVTFCILYFFSNSCSTCFGQPCAHHQELTTAWCYSLVLVCAVAAGRLSSPVGR